MTEPRIVTPLEAQDVLSDIERQRLYAHRYDDLAYTVATEPDRIRAAVAKALRETANRLRVTAGWQPATQVHASADAIENGAPL